MARLQLLSPDLAQSLKSAVRHAASEALNTPTASAKSTDAALHRMLNADLNACVAEVISELSSSFNCPATVLARFSNELWCIVFSYLPAVPLVAATHVCRTWRTVALGCAILWCNIQYRDDLRYDRYSSIVDETIFGKPECPVGARSKKLDLMRSFLSRSGGILPISLDIEFPFLSGFRASHIELNLLAGALKPYAHRLATLHFFCKDQNAHTEFLANFDCLSALHTLSVRCYESPYSWLPSRGALFLSRPLSLPALKSLHLVVPDDSGVDAPHDLHSLVSLDMGFVRAGDILTYLSVSPNVRQLQLHAPPFFERDWPRESPEIYDRVRAQAPACDIKLINIHANVEDAVLAMFDSDAHLSLLLDYRFPEVMFPRVPGMRILQHLEFIEELSVIPRAVDASDPDGPQKVVVSAHDAASKARTLSFVWEPHMVKLSDIWAHLNVPPLSLVVDARQWPALTPPKRVTTGVKKLTLILSPSFRLSALMQTTLTVPGPFTALEEVIVSSQPGSEARVSLATLRSFLRLLRIPGLEYVLQLHRIEIDGDVTQLNALAGTVVVQ